MSSATQKFTETYPKRSDVIGSVAANIEYCRFSIFDYWCRFPILHDFLSHVKSKIGVAKFYENNHIRYHMATIPYNIEYWLSDFRFYMASKSCNIEYGMCRKIPIFDITWFAWLENHVISNIQNFRYNMVCN